MTDAELSDAMKVIGWPDWLPYRFGDRVMKKVGTCWHGRVVGWYTTEHTQIGICVESEYESGSVQIYPAKALIPWSGK